MKETWYKKSNVHKKFHGVYVSFDLHPDQHYGILNPSWASQRSALNSQRLKQSKSLPQDQEMTLRNPQIDISIRIGQEYMASSRIWSVDQIDVCRSANSSNSVAYSSNSASRHGGIQHLSCSGICPHRIRGRIAG